MAEPLARYVAGLAGLGLSVGQTCGWGFQPDDPDDHVSFFDESAPEFEASDTASNDNLGVQVLTRSATYEGARDRAFAIHKKIAGFGGGELSAGFPRVVKVGVVTPPTSIGRDHRRRSQFSAHYEVLIESEGDVHRT